MSKIESFSDNYAFLSNFYETPVWYNGIMFKNSEAAFQAQKVLDPNERIKFKYLTAKEAKKLGRKIELRPDWDDIKLKVMEEICLAKFAQNANLREALINTCDTELIEGNTWGDIFWGCANGKGENNLGKILMKIRKMLSSNYIFTMQPIDSILKAYENIEDGDRFIVAVLELNCISIELQIENCDDNKCVTLYVCGKYFDRTSDIWDSIDYESENDYTELLSTATSKEEIERFMACKLFKWCTEHSIDILKESIPMYHSFCSEPVGEEASKFGIMFYANIPASDAEKIDKHAEKLFIRNQTALDDYIKALGYEWEMGAVRKPKENKGEQK